MFLGSGLHIDQAPPLHLPVRFFATAPLFMALAGVAILFWHTDLLLAPLLGPVIATAHLVVLGWLTMVMMGAMYQMIPVLAGTRVPWLAAAPAVHGLLTAGVVSLVVGLAGEFHPAWWLLLAAVCLGGAVVLFVGPVALALVRAPAQHPTVVAMRMAVAALTGTMLFGLVFLGEHAHGFLAIDREAMVGVHLTWGVLGWVGVLIVGVSFQVLPMFYMTPQFPTRTAGRILAGLGGSLLLLPFALLGSEQPAWRWLAALPGLAALLHYAWVMGGLIQRRQRKRVDPTLRFWWLGFGCGATGVLLLALWPAWDETRLRFLFGVLFLLGGAGSIVLGMLYKIVPFLVWFHRFSRLAGLADIPMMDDLVPEQWAKHHPTLHAVAVAALLLGIVGQWAPLLWLGGAGLIASAGVLAYALWYAWRQQPPEMPAMPDFASFFKDMPLE